MIVLAIDTALAAAQAALAEGDAILAQACEPMARGHQERLAPLVVGLLEGAGVAPGRIGRVVVTVGPGSFTGLRVGLAFAKTFALARGVPCVGVGTLEALAGAWSAGAVAAAIAAPHERVYLQRFADSAPVEPPRLLSLADARPAVAGARVVGPGAEPLGGAAADAVGWLDIAALARRGAVATAPPDPIYLREVSARTLAERRADAARG